MRDRFLKRTGHSGRYGYPTTLQESSYSVDWNQLCETTPFYAPSQYLRIDRDALSLADKMFHAPHRFRNPPLNAGRC